MLAEASAASGEGGVIGSNLRAALIVLCAFAVFSGTDALVKLLSERFPVPQVTFMITAAGLTFVVASAVMSGRGEALLPRHPRLAFARAILLAGDTLLIHYAFAALPLAEAYVLSFLSPALVALLAFAFLGERSSAAGWFGVLLGFSGVIVALQPGATALRFGHIAAVGSALLFALSLVLLRRTKATESDTALVASLLLVLSVLSFAVTLTRGGFAAVTPTDIAIATAAGLTLFCGLVLLVRAVVAPFQYTRSSGDAFTAPCCLALPSKPTPSSAPQSLLVPAG